LLAELINAFAQEIETLRIESQDDSMQFHDSKNASYKAGCDDQGDEQ
jgi:hypothetical protein